MQGARPEVDEGRGAGRADGEPDRGARAEQLGAAVEVEVDVDRVDGDEGGPGGGLGAGQGRHPPTQPERCAKAGRRGRDLAGHPRTGGRADGAVAGQTEAKTRSRGDGRAIGLTGRLGLVLWP